MNQPSVWNSEELIAHYAKNFGIDIAEYVHSPQITMERDAKSGILMFTGCDPGGGEFYEQLADKPFYYTNDKWEFSEAFKCFPGDSKEISVLEIGCGSGDFLERCRQAGYRNAQGIEFNAKALQLCQEKQLQVTDSRIESLAETDERFDVVCAFQVLEHVPDPVTFIQQASAVLSEGGRLIFSTPNAESFLQRFRWHLLDLPPHHMSRWDRESYQTTAGLLGLHLEEVRLEPLAKYHYRLFPTSFLESLPARGLRRRIAKPLLRMAFKLYPFKNSIMGHTIMAVFRL